ncbi:MAG: hypothetical protein F7C32_02685 [Desulfurococcales archaeon]|nr:hypothetical protein [Desulfurococcales archaeon]
MAGYPIIAYEPTMSGETDQPLELQLVDLAKMDTGGYMRVVHHSGERGYHVKLVLNESEAISLFVWNVKIFRCQNTLARSYGVIPIEEIEVDEEEGDTLVAEGSYQLSRGVLELIVEKSYDEGVVEPGYRCRFLLRLRGVKEYISPKHGHSARPEYFLVALKSRR